MRENNEGPGLQGHRAVATGRIGMARIGQFARALALGAGLLLAAGAAGDALAQQKKFSFAYDQPRTTAYGIAADIFNAKLMELSGGKLSIDQFPLAQLGQEPVMLQKLRSGDIDFVITSTANASTLAPQAGVFSLHFIFRDQDHLAKTLADPQVSQAFREMIKESVQGAHAHRQQEGSEIDRRRQGPEGARAGDQDRGHAV